MKVQLLTQRLCALGIALVLTAATLVATTSHVFAQEPSAAAKTTSRLWLTTCGLH